jgi:nitronate monooxygenase
MVRQIQAGGRIAPFPAQNWLTGRIRAAAATRDNVELLSLWMGQAARLATLGDADAVFAELSAGIADQGPSA